MALVNHGIPVLGDDNWTISGQDRFPLFNGYICARLVKSNTGDLFKVLRSINESALKLPLFTCSAYKYDQDKKDFCQTKHTQLTLTKSSSVANGILKRLNVETKKVWNGKSFFGLDRDLIRTILNEKILQLSSTKNTRVNENMSKF